MEEDWVGKAVSIECDEKLGVFQGIIKDISASQITIVRAFRNGVPLRKQDAEITLRSTDIERIDIISAYNGQNTVTPTVINKPTPVKQPNFPNAAAVNVSAAVEFVTTPTGNKYLQQQNLEVVDLFAPKNTTSELSNTISNMNLNGGNISPSAVPFVFPNTDQLHKLTRSNDDASNGKPTSPPMCNTVAQFFGNLIPSKVEVRLGTAFAPGSSTSTTSTSTNCTAESYSSITKPIDILNERFRDGSDNNSCGAAYSQSNGNGKSRNGGNGGNGHSTPGGNGNTRKQQRKQVRRENSIKHQQTFGTSVDDPLIHEEFDFEGNLALFDKQAIWDDIESEQKPDLVRQAVTIQKKYRHDENILASEPLQLRQIESVFDGSTEFVTDEGLVIPTIPSYVRSKIEMSAEKGGLSIQRQIDILARGATDLAIMLLGGARRLTPNNSHQWPKIAIICDKSVDFRSSNIGAATGRQLASHGLKVLLYLEKDMNIEKQSIEISLFKATGNTVVYSVNAIPRPDLVILSTHSRILSEDVKKWLSESRASILAIDPPPNGVQDVSMKYAILPILPLNGISANNCGKLYLCNLGIPDKFYRDAGIKYKSPFGHKFVIPIHSKD